LTINEVAKSMIYQRVENNRLKMEQAHYLEEILFWG